MSDFMPAPKNGSRFEFRTIVEMISAFEHLKRVLMGVMLEPRNSKRPLFGRIFQPLIDALRDTDMNTRLDFLPIDFIVRKCNHMVMEWSKLYSNENNEHLPSWRSTKPHLQSRSLNGNTSDATSHLSPDKTRSRKNTSSTRRPTTTTSRSSA